VKAGLKSFREFLGFSVISFLPGIDSSSLLLIEYASSLFIFRY